ncbi:MAG: hypothetical protein IT379_28865 [Deltaproteobacteria bacterium]|nr:hypothetical protein [Deltaproteobacteria bacterium]
MRLPGQLPKRPHDLGGAAHARVVRARTMLPVAALVAWVAASSGCADDLTQLVVVVHTDLATDQVDAIAVEVDATAAGGAIRRYEGSLVGGGALRLPATLSIVSRDGTNGAVVVRAEARHAGETVLRREAVVRFVRGESRTLKLDLLSCCLGVTCGDSQTCSEHGCIDRDQQDVELPRWTGTAPQRASCQERDAGVDMGTGPDAASDSGLDAAADAGPVDPCMPRRPPVRPGGIDDGTGTVRWYAIRRLDVGTGGRFGEIGWDHDGLCTDIDSTVLACEPAPAFSAPSDGPGGVDNAFAQSLAPLFDLFVPGFFEQTNTDIDRGRFSFLIRIDGWNGLPDDPLVDVGLVDGVEGIRVGETLDDAGMVAEDASVPLPDGGAITRSLAWDGTDRWYGNRDSVVGGDPEEPMTRDRTAYVSGGILVARTTRPVVFTLSAVAVALPIRLGAGTIFSGRLVDGGSRIEEGVVAGRWAVDDILDSVVNGFGICAGTLQYERTVETLERVADLSLDRDPGAPVRCDAVSAGIGYSAVEVEIGGLAQSGPRLVDCRSLDAGVRDADVEGGVGSDGSVEAGVRFDGGDGAPARD